MNKRFLIITASFVIFLTLVIAIVSLSRSLGTGALDLTIQPADATVTIDGKPAEPTKAISLSTGKHSVTIKRDGFTPRTFTAEIAGGKTLNKTITLTAANDTGQAYLDAHPEVTAQAEGQAGQSVEANGAKITQDNPLIQLLPYRGSTYSIGVGVSKAHPDDDRAVGVYITAPAADDKTKALNWIKAQGYDPNAYEIIYQ